MPVDDRTRQDATRNGSRMAPVFGAERCPVCREYDCLDHLPIEKDYPDSAWNHERHDYGPKEDE